MRILLQLLAAWLWPTRTKPPARGSDAYVRALLILAIVLFCGPEVFAAADLIALLDLLGVAMFLTSFAVGYRALAMAAVSAAQRILLPSEWIALIRTRKQPTLVAHGLLLAGRNALIVSLLSLASMIGIADVAMHLI